MKQTIARGAGRLHGNPLRIKDLKAVYSDVLAVHAEFIAIRSDGTGRIEGEIVELEQEFYAKAAGQSEACKFDEVDENKHLFGVYRTAYINCCTYIARIGSANKLFRLTG